MCQEYVIFNYQNVAFELYVSIYTIGIKVYMAYWNVHAYIER